MRKSVLRAVVSSALIASAVAFIAPAFAADAPKEQKVELTLLGETADSVVSGDGLNHTLDKLAASDRDRVKKDLDAKHDDFAKLVKQFRDAWHDKYNTDFDAAGHTGVLEQNHVDRKENNGNKYEHVLFTKHGDVDAFEVHLIRDHGEWRVDLPKDVNGGKLLVRATHSVRELLNKKSEWPKDESPAYELATAALLHPFASDPDKPAKQ